MSFPVMMDQARPARDSCFSPLSILDFLLLVSSKQSTGHSNANHHQHNPDDDLDRAQGYLFH